MSITVGGKENTKFKTLAGMPNTHKMAGMPDTKRMNGGWGSNYSGNIGNSGSSLLQKKRSSLIQDPQERRRQGQIRLDESDNAPGFIKDKVAQKGSISVAGYGLCLKGEEGGGIPEDGSFYGVKNGKRGWYPVTSGGGKGAERVVPFSGGASSCGMFAWDEENQLMGPGGVMVGRQWVDASGTGPLGDGEYWLKVTLSSGGATATVQEGNTTDSDLECVIPIYTIEGGKIVKDLRGAFVVSCWE